MADLKGGHARMSSPMNLMDKRSDLRLRNFTTLRGEGLVWYDAKP